MTIVGDGIIGDGTTGMVTDGDGIIGMEMVGDGIADGTAQIGDGDGTHGTDLTGVGDGIIGMVTDGDGIMVGMEMVGVGTMVGMVTIMPTLTEEEIRTNEAYRYLKDMESSLEVEDQFVQQFPDYS
jgi:hypothetical protein